MMTHPKYFYDDRHLTPISESLLRGYFPLKSPMLILLPCHSRILSLYFDCSLLAVQSSNPPFSGAQVLPGPGAALVSSKAAIQCPSFGFNMV